MAETEVWDEDRIAAAAEVAAHKYLADLNTIWQEFGGFAGDWGIAGWELWRAMNDDPDCLAHYTAFIDYMQDGLHELSRSERPGWFMTSSEHLARRGIAAHAEMKQDDVLRDLLNSDEQVEALGRLRGAWVAYTRTLQHHVTAASA